MARAAEEPHASFSPDFDTATRTKDVRAWLRRLADGAGQARLRRMGQDADGIRRWINRRESCAHAMGDRPMGANSHARTAGIVSRGAVRRRGAATVSD